MKRKILTFILVCFTSIIYAQDSSHLKFRDIEINGSARQFIEQLKPKGYRPTSASSQLLSGEFAGKDCEIAVYESEISKILYQVIVVYDTDGKPWSSVKSDYNRLKDLYQSKYGKPTSSTERFVSPYYEGDGYELSAVRLSKAIFLSKWDFPNGEVNIVITNKRIMISFKDKQNSAINDKEERNKSISDI